MRQLRRNLQVNKDKRARGNFRSKVTSKHTRKVFPWLNTNLYVFCFEKIVEGVSIMCYTHPTKKSYLQDSEGAFINSAYMHSLTNKKG